MSCWIVQTLDPEARIETYGSTGFKADNFCSHNELTGCLLLRKIMFSFCLHASVSVVPIAIGGNNFDGDGACKHF